MFGGSHVSGRSAGSCCFEHGEWYLCCLDMIAGMSRDGRERDRILTNDYLPALHGCDLARGHPEAFRDRKHLILFDPELIQHIRNLEGWFDFFFSAGETYPRGKVLHNVSPVIRFVCDVKSRK